MKDKNLAGILALFFGGLGVHKFYLGKPIQGLIYLLFSWTAVPAFIAIFEALYYFFSSEEKFNLKYNRRLIQCPHCAEFIKPEAKLCKYCHSSLD